MNLKLQIFLINRTTGSLSWTKFCCIDLNFSNFQAGYVGEDVESILYKLLAVCALFCRTIVFQ